MPRCWHCKAETPAAHWERVVENKTALHGPWEGWRLSGQYLIAPGKAGRIMPARLLGMLWEERHRSALMNVQLRRSPPHISHLPARERFDGQA